MSLGEQQRIGMARLFYHKPKYGVLDECTSAVSVDVEEKLYTEAAARDITCITISQRLALEEFHSQVVFLSPPRLSHLLAPTCTCTNRIYRIRSVFAPLQLLRDFTRR